LCVYSQGDHLWQANFRLPPGLEPGWHMLRLRFPGSRFSQEWQIAVDMELRVERLTMLAVLDGRARTPNEVRLGKGATVTCWVKGLADNSDRVNTTVWLDGRRLRVDYMGEPVPAASGGTGRQVNAVLPPDATPGEYEIRVECAGVSTDTALVRLLA